MIKSENINELATALSVAQGQIQNAKKDANNPFFKSHYADLASVWDVCRKPLTDNGLSVVQTIENINGKQVLETTLLHASGQFITGYMELTTKDDGMQAAGSAITYARRYQLSAMVGVCADEDDDGNAATGRIEQKYGGTVTKVEDKPLASPVAPTNAIICTIHKTPMAHHAKDGKEWDSHQLPDGKWCYGKPPAKKSETKTEELFPT